MMNDLQTEEKPLETGVIAPTATDPGAEPPQKDGVAEPEKAVEVAETPALTAADLTLPEGFAADEADMASFLEFSAANSFSKEQAQAALQLYAKQVSQLGETMQQQWEATQTQWQEQCRALPDIGGDKLDGSLAEVAKLVDRYGSEDLRTAMDVTGAGNHPAVVQFLHRISKVVNEAPPVSGQPTATANLSRADRMFKGA